MTIAFVILWIGVVAISVAMLIYFVQDVHRSEGPKEKVFVAVASGSLLAALISSTFTHFNGILAVALWYLGNQFIQRKRLDIRLNEGISQFKSHSLHPNKTIEPTIHSSGVSGEARHD